MIESIATVLEWLILVFPIIGLYVTAIHYKWWKLYRPSPLIKHLLIASAAVDFASIMVAIVAASVLFNFPLPEGASTLMIGGALVITMGVKVYRRISLRALDNPDEDLQQRVETQNEREDRQFGEERRNLEVKHIEEANGADQE